MIDPTARIEVDELVMGEGCTVRAHAEIYGTRVVLGRECFIDEYAVIGGGSAGEFTAGDWFHLGMFAQVNTACPVTVGDEVGIGIGSRIFTHGAYLSEWDGFPAEFEPVTIGSRAWLPSAVVLPGVTIGDDVVIAAGSVVTSDIESGCFAAGAPAVVLRKECYPAIPPNRDRILARVCERAGCGKVSGIQIHCADATFDIERRVVYGRVSWESEQVRNQLRRHGIRFRFEPHDGKYRAWL